MDRGFNHDPIVERNMKRPLLERAFHILMSLGELTDSLPLFEDDRAHEDRQDRPDDHKHPNVNFLIGNAEDICPVHQYPYAPIENLIHHVCLRFLRCAHFMTHGLSKACMCSQISSSFQKETGLMSYLHCISATGIVFACFQLSAKLIGVET